MRLTIKEALCFGGLKGAQVVAGAKYLDQQIESISVLEVAEPKISTWVVKNEIYITSFYAIRDDVEMQRAVIRSLFNHGCCALVICHIGLVFDILDPSVIRLCEELPLPLIVAKSESTYVQIIQPIIETLMKEEEGVETASSFKIRDDFLDLIINEDDMQEVFEKVSFMLKYDISYYDIDCNCIYSNKSEQEVEEEIDQIKENLSAVLKECELHRCITMAGKEYLHLVYLIRTRRSLLGFIVINYLNESELPALLKTSEALNVACALTFSRQNKRKDIKERYLQEFLGDLLVWNFRNDEIALRRGREFGMRLEKKDRIMVVNINTLQQTSNRLKSQELAAYVKKYLCPNVADLMRGLHKHNLTVYRSDMIIVFLEEADMEARLIQVAEQIITMFEDIGDFSVSIGISELFAHLRDIPAAYKQAFRAVISGRLHYGENKVVPYRDVWFFQKIEELARAEGMDKRCHELLVPLKQYDQNHQSNLAETLMLLLKHNNNIGKVAKLMYLHRNTLLHRKNKIIEIYGYSPFEMPYLLNFLVVMNILEK